MTGPAEVFATAGGYRVEVLAPETAPIATRAGYAIVPTRALRDDDGPIDTLVVAGGAGARDPRRDGDTLGWLRAAEPRARRVASVCTGAFLLARAGLLDGRRAGRRTGRAARPWRASSRR